MNSDHTPIEKAGADLRNAVGRLPEMAPRIPGKRHPVTTFATAAIAVILVIGVPVLFSQTRTGDDPPAIGAVSTTSGPSMPAETSTAANSTTTVSTAPQCGSELPFTTVMPDDFKGPFPGPSPDALDPAEPGQTLLHWTGRGGSVELRWPANLDYTESAQWGAEPTSPDTDQVFFVTVEDVTIDGVEYPGSPQLYAVLPTSEMAGPCGAVQLRVLEPSAGGTGVSYLGALTRQVDPERPNILVIYPELPRPRDLELIVGSFAVDTVPEVVECSGGAEEAGFDVPPIKTETISDPESFPTPIEALEALIDGQDTWPKTGYFELHEMDGSITYGNPLDDLSVDPRPERGLVISVSVIEIDGGWAVDAWSSSGC